MIEKSSQARPSAAVVERSAVRVVIVDATGNVLLISTQDSSNPGFPETWELPGGGLNASESLAAGAIREVSEETGIQLTEDQLIGPLWNRLVHYSYRGERRAQHEEIFLANIEATSPELDLTHRELFEREDHSRYAWIPPHDIQLADLAFYPKNLPTHIHNLLQGMTINDPLEVWPEL